MEHRTFSGLITARETVELVSLSRVSLWRMAKTGRFPSPCDLGNGKIRWREDEVRDWLSKLPSRQYPAKSHPVKPGKSPKHDGGGHA